jgi:hypothetical protein
MPESVQVDHYGRVVNINTEELLKGMTAPVNRVEKDTSAAGRLADKEQKKETHDTLLDPKKVKKFEEFLKEVRDVVVQHKSEAKSDGLKDLANSIERMMGKSLDHDSIWTDGRTKAVDKFLYEATHGSSIHVHDFTAASILVQISKDIKHIGMLINQVVASNAPRALGSFMEFNFPQPEPERGKRYNLYGTRPNNVPTTQGAPSPDVNPSGNPRKATASSVANDAGTVVPGAGTVMGGATVVANAGVVVDSGGKRVETTLERDMEGLTDTTETLAAAQAQMEKILNRNIKQLRILPDRLEKILEAFNFSGTNADDRNQIALVVQDIHKLNKDERQKIVDAFSSLNKTLIEFGADSAQFRAAVQDFAAHARYTNESQRGFFNRFRIWSERINNVGTSISKIGEFLKKFQPANVGIGTEFNPEERIKRIREEWVAWNMDIHATLAQTTGMLGSMMGGGKGIGSGFRESPANMVDYWKEANRLAENYNETGQSVANVQKVLINNLKRGVTQLSSWSKMSKQGLILSKMIGTEAEGTADELADWNQHLGLSVDQTGQLARSIQTVGKITGLTGDRLMDAVKSSKTFAENMRNAGTFTNEAAKNIIQASAAMKKNGMEKTLQPLLDAMSSTTALFDRASPQTFSLLMRAAQAGGGTELMQRLQEGTVMNSRESGLKMAKGLQSVLMQLTGGRSVAQLSSRERMSPQPANQERLRHGNRRDGDCRQNFT